MIPKAKQMTQKMTSKSKKNEISKYVTLTVLMMILSNAIMAQQSNMNKTVGKALIMSKRKLKESWSRDWIYMTKIWQS